MTRPRGGAANGEADWTSRQSLITKVIARSVVATSHLAALANRGRAAKAGLALEFLTMLT